MALTKDDYRDMLLRLLPHGPAWSRENSDINVRMLDAWAEELARIDGRAEQLLEEADPRTTSEMLADWERNLGLPDECLTPAASVAERRARVHQKLVWKGGQSAAFFISLLASLGYPGATVTEFRPFRANSKCNAALNQGGWRYAWRINVSEAADVKRLTVTGRCNEPLASWGDPGLYCLLNKYKPAHTVLFIAYQGA